MPALPPCPARDRLPPVLRNRRQLNIAIRAFLNMRPGGRPLPRRRVDPRRRFQRISFCMGGCLVFNSVDPLDQSTRHLTGQSLGCISGRCAGLFAPVDIIWRGGGNIFFGRMGFTPGRAAACSHTYSLPPNTYPGAVFYVGSPYDKAVDEEVLEEVRCMGVPLPGAARDPQAAHLWFPCGRPCGFIVVL